MSLSLEDIVAETKTWIVNFLNEKKGFEKIETYDFTIHPFRGGYYLFEVNRNGHIKSLTDLAMEEVFNIAMDLDCGEYKEV